MLKNLPQYSLCQLTGARRCAHDVLVAGLSKFVDAHRNLALPHTHDFYQIFLLTAGGGRQAVDLNWYEVIPGQVVHLAPGQAHAWEFMPGTDGYVVNFTESFFASVCQNTHYLRGFNLFKPTSVEPVAVLPHHAFGSIKKIFSEMEVEFQERGAFWSDMLRALLLTALVQLSREMPEKAAAHQPNHQEAVMHHFEQLIEQHFREEHLPRQYAGRLFISPSHLNALSNLHTGKSAGELIRDRILMEAKRLLANSDLLVAQIADHLCFEDCAYFIRFFKKYTGLTPERYRTTWKNTATSLPTWKNRSNANSKKKAAS